jgi:hypothetical protein
LRRDGGGLLDLNMSPIQEPKKMAVVGRRRRWRRVRNLTCIRNIT